MLDEIEPRCVIVYGSMSPKVFDDFKNRTTFIQFDDWTTTRKRGVQNGNY